MAGANVKEFTTENWNRKSSTASSRCSSISGRSWCGPCRALAPTIDKLADQYAGKVKVGKLDADDNQDLAVRYGISGIPQLLIFRGGDQPRERMVGLQREQDLVKVIDRVLQG